MALMDRDGNATMVWTKVAGGYSNVYTSSYVPGSGWGSDTEIDYGGVGANNAYNPQVAMNSEGYTMVVWEQFNSLIRNIYTNLFYP
jgi:hypothetical protein